MNSARRLSSLLDDKSVWGSANLAGSLHQIVAAKTIHGSDKVVKI